MSTIGTAQNTQGTSPATAGATGTTTGTLTSKNPNATMGQADFLKLLIAQLKHQDPLNPMNSDAFTSEMAQFSSLEQLTNINTNLGGLANVQNAVNNSEAMGMIGRTIQAAGNSVSITNGKATSVNFNLADASHTTTVAISNSQGQVVNVLPQGALGAGNQTVPWDGKDSNGNLLPDGTYTYTVNAADASGNPVLSTTYMTGVVSSVSVLNGTTSLNVGNQQVSLGSVMNVK
ncbi:MAG: flagellar hook assembly protein FlgD [Nitrospinae bacterium]|nr:flagellar hook assembly protein FlgD [Nitrospinota bacterium]